MSTDAGLGSAAAPVSDEARESTLGRAVSVYAAVYFVASYALAVYWFRQGMFVPGDFFFDADAGPNLATFSVDGGRFALTHPLLEWLKIPVLSLSYVVSSISGQEFALTSRYVAMLISPLAKAGCLVLVFHTLRHLGTSEAMAALATVVFGFWNTNLFFAVLPETFGLSCLLIAALFYVLVRGANRDAEVLWPDAPNGWPSVDALLRRPRRDALIIFLIGVAMAGVTITNLAIFVIILWAHRGGPWTSLSVLRKVLVPAVLIAVIVEVLFFVGLLVIGQERGPEGNPDWLRYYLHHHPKYIGGNILGLYAQFLNMIVAAAPRMGEYGQTFQVDVSMATVAVLLGATAMLAVIAWSVRQPSSATEEWVKRASLLVIAYNLMMHSVFGEEMFLYTQHWAVPTLLLLMPAIKKAPRTVVALSIVCTLVNFQYMSTIRPELIPPPPDFGDTSVEPGDA